MSVENSKYAPLYRHLCDRPGPEWHASFGEIEKVLRAMLPNSAYESWWWGNTRNKGRVQARAWMEAGWKISNVNTDKRRLIFQRMCDSERFYRNRTNTIPTYQNGSQGEIHYGDNLPFLEEMAGQSVPLIYIDPPFNTGKIQSRTRIKTCAVDNAMLTDRTGFGGRRYQTEVIGKSGYADSFSDYLGFLRPRLVEAHRILTANGSLFFHIDWRESARCRLLLEEIFGGAEHCINEIIWVYDFGARSKRKWSAKHDTIFWFAKNPNDYIFNYDAMDRIPYMAPSLVGHEKAARGKTPTDTWWQTIVPTNGREKTGYPTQKPLKILDRIVRIHSNPGEVVLDFFAGSGTTGEAAIINGRHFVLMDKNPEAIRTINKRLNPLVNEKQPISQGEIPETSIVTKSQKQVVSPFGNITA